MCFSDKRRLLLVGLKTAIDHLAAAGCLAVILDGSFVTSKDEPGDFDMAWEPDGIDVTLLHPVLRLVHPPRTAQKIKYGGDILPDRNGVFTDFFQGTRDGERKGVIRIDLRTGR